jgi:hypothetical protein
VFNILLTTTNFKDFSLRSKWQKRQWRKAESEPNLIDVPPSGTEFYGIAAQFVMLFSIEDDIEDIPL